MLSLTGTILFPLAATVLLILTNACFVAAEFSLVKIRRTRLEELSEDGVKSAQSAIFCVDNLQRMLSATQLGITLASLSLGWVGQSFFANIVAPLLPEPIFARGSFHHVIGATLSLTMLTLFHVVLGELVPKNMAISNAEQTILFMARPLRAFALLTHPLIQIFSRFAAWVLRWFGYDGLHEKPLSEDELKLVMEDSRDGGILSEGEAKIINSAFAFADKQAVDIMVPTEKVISVSLERPFIENLALIEKTHHTRFPLCQSSMKELVGIIHIKDIYQEFIRNGGEQKIAQTRIVRDVIIALQYTHAQ